MASFQEVQLPINGVTLYLNKVVSDSRGHFMDLAETDNPSVGSTKHIHSAIALHKGVSRGEHYHLRVVEDFYTLSGTALGILHDFNEESPTFGKTFAYVSGNKDDSVKTDLPTYYIEDGTLAQVRIMPKVWHAWWPLTDKEVVIVALGTLGYDPQDYGKPKAQEIPGVMDILTAYGINTD